MVGVPMHTEGYVLERAMGVVKDGGAPPPLARCLANMPDRQVEALIAIQFVKKRTSYVEIALETELFLEACKRQDNGTQRPDGKTLELSGAAGAQSFFLEGFPINRLTFQPHKQTQARLSMGWER